jgi:hypothetical protein
MFKKAIRCPLFLLLALPCCVSSAYSQDILWEKSYGGKHADYLMDAQPTADYGFILAGSSLSKKSGNKTEDNNGDLDYWVWKMDEKGDLDWQKNFGGSGADFLQSIALTGDGGFILAGTSASVKGLDKKEDSRGGDDFWIIKLNAKGGEEWQKTIGGSDQEKLQSIYQTKDGGYILGGSSSSDSSPSPTEGGEQNRGEKTADSFGNMDYWVVKLDPKGKIEWQKTMGGIYFDELRSIEQTKDGGFILGGYSNSPASGNKTNDNMGIGDFWVIKLDGKGNEQWQKTIGGDKDDQLYVVHQTYDKGFILGGNSNSGSSEGKSKGNEKGTDFWVLKLDEEGTTVWQETYNIGNVDVLTSLIENDDHTLLLGGFAQGESVQTVGGKRQMAGESAKMKKGTDDYVAIKVSEKGEELWRQAVGSAGEDLLKKAIETRDGGYLLTGTSNAFPSAGGVSNGRGGSRDRNSNIGSNDFWVVKLKDKTKPAKVKASIEAFPNPTPAFTNVIVGYDFENGTATVADLAGHVLQQFDITSRTVPVDLSRYPEGIYVVNIKTNVQSDGVKVIKGMNNN